MDEEGTEMILERTQVPVVTLCYLCDRKDDPSAAVLKFTQRSVMVNSSGEAFESSKTGVYNLQYL